MNQLSNPGACTKKSFRSVRRQTGRACVHSLNAVFSKHAIRQISVLAAILIFSAQLTFAQNRQVSGTVFDNSGAPLPGASVQLKGTTTGTITDTDGKYTIQTRDGLTLVFSYIGYIKQEVAIGAQTTIDVTLKSEESSLSEVVVVGYGTRTKANLSGSVTTGNWQSDRFLTFRISYKAGYPVLM
jgi:hypothetical protein